MSKFANLVAFIDGTGNNAFKQKADEQTNVARLWHACREKRKKKLLKNLKKK